MIPRVPQMLQVLTTALPLIPITIAFPVDTSPIRNAIEGSPQARNTHSLSTGAVNCNPDFPQFYNIHDSGMKDIFQEAASFRANSQQVCDDIVPYLYKPEQKEHTLYFDVHDADIYVNTEQVLWDKTLRVVYKVSLTDKGYEGVHGRNPVSQKAFNGFCVGALEEYGTKGKEKEKKGCTKDPQDFSNSVNRRTTTTGVLGGSMEWMDGNEHFATLEVSFEKAKSQVS
ncbi:hypothetical protein BDW59DRAFT_157752 [Aspergillus cavernicola]|uniref:Uncharacterized protein n=1 Tax=Aspergillus cavernicola TaxID=176166 RepID=A0ABR4IVJ3_9EURO